MGMQLSGGAAKRGRRALSSEINVTPFVDVMLVLLIIFMVTANALQRGVDVVVPQAAAKQLPVPKETPLVVSVTPDGAIFIEETEIPAEELTSKLFAIAEQGYKERIYIRGDTAADYGKVVDVIARIQTAGFTNFALVTDPKSRIEKAQ